MEKEARVNPETIKKLFALLNSEIEYVLIKNVGDELPHKLKRNKDVDLLVKSHDAKRVQELVLHNKFRQITHPQSRETGWHFAYGASECTFFRINEECFEIDIHQELCLKSLMGNIWIPMDNYINNRVWNEKRWDEQNNWWIIDDQTQLVYLIARCVFDKGTFSEVYIDEIEKRKHLLVESVVLYMLEKVFFGFSNELVRMLHDGRYQSIVSDYLAFSDY
jgi:hypothetical protein